MSSTTQTPLYAALGLTSGEYDDITKILGREPDHAELAMFSVMWSEHCSYKSSRPHLRTFPTEAPWLVVGVGENAGVVEVAPGLRVAFKMESHNHPSAVEPFQGAATGVGGIVRDILALGARPVALLDPLRFGPLDDPRNRYLFDGVVRGIANYGNAIGVPVVGGEAVFDPSYSRNPLVNVMCAGVVTEGEVLRAAASRAGQSGLLFGSKTGRDGIGGASILASAELDEQAEDKRPSVQVGDPFTEKLLIEACLEMKREGLLAGLQDLGAAGITCALAETANAGGLGCEADLDAVLVREDGMEAWEILMSESQERMLAVLEPDRVARAQAICTKWGLDATVVGRYTDGGRLEVSFSGERIVDVPAEALAEGIVYDRPVSEPERAELHAVDPLSLAYPNDMKALLLQVLRSPSIGSKRWVWQQYDHMVRLNGLVGPGSDAAVLRLPESEDDRVRQTGIALACDGSGRLTYLDAYTGGALAVCESARNVAATGARPFAITNCLNFPNPEVPQTMGAFAAAVRGIGDACRAFGIPVTGGNVSFYNEGGGMAIHPTPIVGMLGVLDDAYAHRPQAPRPGQVVLLFGETRPELGGSEVLWQVHERICGPPPTLDLRAEVALARLLSDPALPGYAHDVSEGGLGVALAELCIAADTGMKIEVPDGADPLWWLFSESTARALVACDGDEVAPVLDAAKDAGVSAHVLGPLKGPHLEIDGVLDVLVAELRVRHREFLDDVMSR